MSTPQFIVGRTIPVPIHLKDPHYKGSARLGHGEERPTRHLVNEQLFDHPRRDVVPAEVGMAARAVRIDLDRMAGEGVTRMPPVGSSERDLDGEELQRALVDDPAHVHLAARDDGYVDLGGEHELLAGIQVLLGAQVALEMAMRVDRRVDEGRAAAEAFAHGTRLSEDVEGLV